MPRSFAAHPFLRSPASRTDRGPYNPTTPPIFHAQRQNFICRPLITQNPHKLGFPFDAWVATWMSGLFEHGRWSDHVAGWRAEWLQNPSQVIWLKYEDLIKVGVGML